MLLETWRDMAAARKMLLAIPLPYLYYLRRNLKNAAVGHGMGRYTREEYMQIGMEDLNALNTFLGICRILGMTSLSYCDPVSPDPKTFFGVPTETPPKE